MLTKNLICASRNTYKFPFLLLARDNMRRNSSLQKYFPLRMAHDFKIRTARYCPAEILKDCLFSAKLKIVVCLSSGAHYRISK